MDHIAELRDALKWLIHCLNRHQQYLPRVSDWDTVAAIKRQGPRVLQYFVDDVSGATQAIKDVQPILNVIAPRIVHPAPVRVGTVSRASYAEAIVALATQVNACCRLYLAHSGPLVQSGEGDLPHKLITEGATASLVGFDWQDVENHLEIELRQIDLRGIQFPDGEKPAEPCLVNRTHIADAVFLSDSGMTKYTADWGKSEIAASGQRAAQWDYHKIRDVLASQWPDYHWPERFVPGMKLEKLRP